MSRQTRVTTPSDNENQFSIVSFGQGDLVNGLLFPFLQYAAEAGHPTIHVVAVNVRQQRLARAAGIGYLLVERLNGQHWSDVIKTVKESIDGFDQIGLAKLAKIMKSTGTQWGTASLTVNAYYLKNGTLDEEADDIKHDLQHPDEPKAFYGQFFNALRKRFEAGIEAPFTLYLLENGLPSDPEKLFLKYAEISGFPYMEQYEKCVDILPAMVDRIAPKLTAEALDELRDHFNWSGHVVVVERFPGLIVVKKGRFDAPPWGTQIKVVEDMLPYTMMKKLLFSMLHIAAGLAGGSLNLPYIHDAARLPSVTEFMRQLHGESFNLLDMTDEMVSYASSVHGRMAASDQPDQVERIVRNILMKLATTVLPTVESLMNKRLPAEHHTFLVALALFNLGSEFLRKQEPLLTQGATAIALDGIRSEISEWLSIRDGQPEGLGAIVEKLSVITGYQIWERMAANPLFMCLLAAQLRSLATNGFDKAFLDVLSGDADKLCKS